MLGSTTPISSVASSYSAGSSASSILLQLSKRVLWVALAVIAVLVVRQAYLTWTTQRRGGGGDASPQAPATSRKPAPTPAPSAAPAPAPAPAAAPAPVQISASSSRVPTIPPAGNTLSVARQKLTEFCLAKDDILIQVAEVGTEGTIIATGVERDDFSKKMKFLAQNDQRFELVGPGKLLPRLNMPQKFCLSLQDLRKTKGSWIDLAIKSFLLPPLIAIVKDYAAPDGLIKDKTGKLESFICTIQNGIMLKTKTLKPKTNDGPPAYNDGPATHDVLSANSNAESPHLILSVRKGKDWTAESDPEIPELVCVSNNQDQTRYYIDLTTSSRSNTVMAYPFRRPEKNLSARQLSKLVSLAKSLLKDRDSTRLYAFPRLGCAFSYLKPHQNRPGECVFIEPGMDQWKADIPPWEKTVERTESCLVDCGKAFHYSPFFELIDDENEPQQPLWEVLVNEPLTESVISSIMSGTAYLGAH